MSETQEFKFRGENLLVKKFAGKAGINYVLVHGIGVSMRYFLPFAEELADTGTVYVIDLPGFGSSPKPEREYTIEDYAEVVEAFIDESQLKRVVLIGHSMGCQVVVEVMRRRPQLSLGVIIGPVINKAERSVPWQMWRLMQDVGREKWGTRMLVFWDYIRCGLRWYLTVLPHMMRYPTEERVGEVNGKLLIVRGSQDLIAPRAWIEQLHKAAKHSETSEIKGAHNVMHEFPATVANRCEELMRV